jgi:hypothetical protein
MLRSLDSGSVSLLPHVARWTLGLSPSFLPSILPSVPSFRPSCLPAFLLFPSPPSFSLSSFFVLAIYGVSFSFFYFVFFCIILIRNRISISFSKGSLIFFPFSCLLGYSFKVYSLHYMASAFSAPNISYDGAYSINNYRTYAALGLHPFLNVFMCLFHQVNNEGTEGKQIWKQADIFFNRI